MTAKTTGKAIRRRREEQPGRNPIEAHWKCPDCGIACYCTGDARALAHPRCGEAGDDSDRDHIADGVAQAAAHWQRDGVEPGGVE